MSFSSENRAKAGIEAAAQLQGGRKTRHQEQPMAAPTPHERERTPPPINVSFSVEKKVGDATLHAYGQEGQEKEAITKVNQAAAKFRDKTQE